MGTLRSCLKGLLTLTMLVVVAAALTLAPEFALAQEAATAVATVAAVGDSGLTCDGGFMCVVAAKYGAYLGVIAAAVILFDRIAKLTPTTKDDGAVSAIYRFFAILGLKVGDNPGPGAKR